MTSSLASFFPSPCPLVSEGSCAPQRDTPISAAVWAMWILIRALLRTSLPPIARILTKLLEDRLPQAVLWLIVRNHQLIIFVALSPAMGSLVMSISPQRCFGV